MESVHAALLACPNITTLDLRVTEINCSTWSPRWNFPFDPAGGDTYPNLKVLRLEGYDLNDKGERESWYMDQCWTGYLSELIKERLNWYYNRDWMAWLTWRLLPKAQREKSNGELWLDAMDWSKIEELAIESPVPGAIKYSLGGSHSLRRLETTDLDLILALPNNTLAELSWVHQRNKPAEYEDVLSILERQGESLRSLEFHCPELSCEFVFPEASYDFGSIPKSTHRLRNLRVNIPHNATWPLETLQTIANILTLGTADTWMNNQSDCREQYELYGEPPPWMEERFGKCEGEYQFQRPFLNDTSALELFMYMKERKQGRELREVTFRVGDFTRLWVGPPYRENWLEGKQAKVVCRTDDIGTEEGWCIVEEDEDH